MSGKKTGLGQGAALLFAPEEERFIECDIQKITPNKHQPRTHFDEEGLEELTLSIAEHGILQPLVVAPETDGEHQLIAGERRFRAAQRAGLKKVPVIIRTIANDDSLLELALIENIQRKDLNVIEEAEAYSKLIEKFHYTQEQTAQRVGKKRSTITNMLRLLQLPQYILHDLQQGALTEGHARVLLRLLETPIELRELRDNIIQKNMSVRQTEKSAQKKSGTEKVMHSPRPDRQPDIHPSYCASISNQLTNFFNSKVYISHSGGRGKIEIDYYSPDDLERIVSLIT